MKIIKSIVFTLLLAANLFAKDKDYGYQINPAQELKVGVNTIGIFIKRREVKITDAKVKLRIYRKGELIASYKSQKVNKNREYLFDLNFDEKGVYNYVLSFNIMGGVTHIRKGQLNIRNGV